MEVWRKYWKLKIPDIEYNRKQKLLKNENNKINKKRKAE